jgi:hypothetical protein
MTIDYSYKIISVDESARCMEVVYTSEGRKTMHISARLPFEGENLVDVIAMFAPVEYWLEQEKAVVVPSVGIVGESSYSLINPSEQAESNEVEL